MPILTMLAICVFVYFALLAVILLFHNRMNPKIVNMIFIIINVILFIIYYLNEFKRQGDRFISKTFDQISPFTFTTLPLSYLFNKKVRDAQFSCVALLSVGMFVAMLITPQQAFWAANRAESTLLFITDTLLHLNCSLFGVYLVASGQVKLNAKCFRNASIYIYSVILFVVLMNTAFHLNYFGMGPYSKYAIYMFKFFNTYWMTLLVYVLGVSVVLAIGFGSNYALYKLSRHEENEPSNLENNINNITEPSTQENLN